MLTQTRVPRLCTRYVPPSDSGVRTALSPGRVLASSARDHQLRLPFRTRMRRPAPSGSCLFALKSTKVEEEAGTKVPRPAAVAAIM
jgi:hypothetical protein